MAIEKPCNTCKLSKPLEEFTVRKVNRDGRTNVCKLCHNQMQHERRVANPVKSKRQSYNFHLKARYGLTLDELEDMIRRQQGLCAICCCPPTPSEIAYRPMSQGLNVDHDHATGRVRMLLCMRCNTMLGGAQDDVDILKRAIEYLHDHR